MWLWTYEVGEFVVDIDHKTSVMVKGSLFTDIYIGFLIVASSSKESLSLDR